MLDRRTAPDPVWLERDACDLDALRDLVGRRTDPDTVRRASDIVANVPVYEAARIERDEPRAVMGEWARVLLEGPGVLAVRGAIRDRALLDDVTAALMRLIDAETAGGGADHFAAAGSNARLWNAHEKLARAAPELFCRYADCPTIDLAATAWLGPAYQVTAQVNLVRPGGKPQVGHRDYHMGFLPPERAALWPAHAHAMSAMLTLQGAIAHSDMPVESGPTKLLPFSQMLSEGYLAIAREDVRALFEERCVQVPLEAGDALFFSPALFHGAGENRTGDHERFANLLQISSAFGRAMEALDRNAMVRAVYPAFLGMRDALGPDGVERVIAATAEGYPFPTDLDRDPPVGGLAPPSQADVLRQAVREGWDEARLHAALDAHAARRSPGARSSLGARRDA